MELTWRTDASTDFPANTANLREKLKFVDEVRIGATLRETVLKQKIATRHSKKVIKREFEVGDLVLRRNQKDSEEGKLTANWDGPFRIRMKAGRDLTDSKTSIECGKTQKVLHLDGKQRRLTLTYVLSSIQRTHRSPTSK
jgi:hypothetical protein